jgi:hypothetical protein
VINYFSGSKKEQQIVIIISFWAIALTSGLRFETGTDYYAYNNYYAVVPTLNNFFSKIPLVEIGYSFINSVFKTLNCEINIMFLFISIVTTVMLFYSLINYIHRRFILFVVLLYYSTIFISLDMSGVRQAISTHIFFVSIRYIHRKEFIKYILLILIASLFHFSSILLIFLYPILNVYLNQRIIFFILFFGIIVLMTRMRWLNTLLGGGMDNLIPNSIAARKISNYITNEYYSETKKVTIRLFFDVILFFLIISKRKKISNLTPYSNILCNMYLLYIISQLYFFESLDISERIGLYFFSGYIVLFPLLLGLLKQFKLNILIGFFIICLFCLYSIRNLYLDNFVPMAMFRPYQSYILEKMGLNRYNIDIETRIKIVREATK